MWKKKKKSNFPSNLALQNLLNYLNKLHNYLLDHVKSLVSQFINTSWCFQQTHLVSKSPPPASPLIIELSTKKKRVDHVTKNTSKYSFVIMYWGRGNLIPPFGRKLCPTQKGFGQFYVCVYVRVRERERESFACSLFMGKMRFTPMI